MNIYNINDYLEFCQTDGMWYFYIEEKKIEINIEKDNFKETSNFEPIISKTENDQLINNPQ